MHKFFYCLKSSFYVSANNNFPPENRFEQMFLRQSPMWRKMLVTLRGVAENLKNIRRATFSTHCQKSAATLAGVSGLVVSSVAAWLNTSDFTIVDADTNSQKEDSGYSFDKVFYMRVEAVLTNMSM